MLLMKLKNWVIKKIGGYTSEEYNIIHRPQPYMCPIINRKDVIRIKANIQVPIFIPIDSDFVKHKLSEQLSYSIQKIMKITKHPSNQNGFVLFEGSIDVIKEAEND